MPHVGAVSRARLDACVCVSRRSGTHLVTLAPGDLSSMNQVGRQGASPSAAVAAAELVAAAGSAVASARAADTGDSLEAGVAAYEAAYPQLTDAQARANAAGADARRAVYDAAAADAATFGGAWFDPLTGTVNVAATTTPRSIGSPHSASVRGRREGVKVKRTAAALEADATSLRAGKDELGKAAAGNVGIDVKTNRGHRRVAGRSQGRPGEQSRGPRREARHGNGPGSRSRRRLHDALGMRLDDPRGRDHVVRVRPRIPWCSVGFTARNSSTRASCTPRATATTGTGSLGHLRRRTSAR